MSVFPFTPNADASREMLLVLADATLKGVVLLAVVAAVMPLLRRASAAARHLTWSGAIIATLLLPVLSFVLPAWRVPWLPDWRPSLVALHDSPIAVPMIMESLASQPVVAQTVASTTPASPASAATPPPEARNPKLETPFSFTLYFAVARAWMLRWSGLIWLVGAGISLIPLALGWWQIARLTRRCTPVSEMDWAELVAQVAGELKLDRPVQARRGWHAQLPLTWGAWRPVLLLPATSDDWTMERRRLVLLHELAHIKRWDWLTQTLAYFACALYWFNPLAWMAARRMRIEREQACDDLVLRCGSRPSDYAGELLQIAAGIQGRGLINWAAVPMARRSTLEGRLLAILDARRNRATLTRVVVLAALALVAAIVVPMAMLRAAPAQTTSASSPKATPAITTDSNAAQVVAIDQDGKYFWGTEAVSAEQLKAKLEALAAKGNPPVIEVRADPTVTYEDVSIVLAMIPKAGLVKFKGNFEKNRLDVADSKISADEVEFLDNKQTIRARTNVTFEVSEYRLLADELIISEKTGTAEASGHVRGTPGPSASHAPGMPFTVSLTTDRFNYDGATKQISLAGNVHLAQGNITATAGQAVYSSAAKTITLSEQAEWTNTATGATARGAQIEWNLNESTVRVLGAAGPAKRILGPVIERVLAASPDPARRALDLDTGEFVASAPPGDITLNTDESDLRVRQGINLVAVEAKAEQFDTATMEEVRSQVGTARYQTQVRLGGVGTQRTYFFNTSTGANGILQILPEAGGAVRARYRLVQGAANTASAQVSEPPTGAARETALKAIVEKWASADPTATARNMPVAVIREFSLKPWADAAVTIDHLDLETGKQSGLSLFLCGEFVRLRREQGVDVDLMNTFDQAGNPVVGYADMDVAPVPNAVWEQTTLPAIYEALARKPRPPEPNPAAVFFPEERAKTNPQTFDPARDKTNTYVFQTREKSFGVLQVVGSKTDPAGVKLRYKLLESGAASQPAVTAAASAPANAAYREVFDKLAGTAPDAKMANAAQAELDAARKHLRDMMTFATGFVTEDAARKAQEAVAIAEAKVAGNATAVAQIKLDSARKDLTRAGQLRGTGVITDLEFERARVAVDLAEAELTGDPKKVAQINLQAARSVLARAEQLHASGVVTDSEYQKARIAVALAEAELTGDPKKIAAVKLEGAREALARMKQLFQSGIVSASEMYKAEAAAATAEAELTDDAVKVAEVKLDATRKQLRLVEQQFNSGFVTASEFEKLQTQVKLAELELKEAADQAISATARPAPIKIGTGAVNVAAPPPAPPPAPSPGVRPSAQLSPTERERMISELVANWAKTDPAAAIAWIASLPPTSGGDATSDRQQAMTAIAGAWAKTDPAAAAAWLQTLPDGPAKNDANWTAMDWATSLTGNPQERYNQAKNELAQAEELYAKGELTPLELQKAKSKFALAEAALTGDSKRVAEVKLDNAQRELAEAEKLFKVGILTPLVFQEFQTRVTLAEADLAVATKLAAAPASSAGPAKGFPAPPPAPPPAAPPSSASKKTEGTALKVAPIKAFIAQGNVTLKNAAGKISTLERGDEFTEGNTVNVGSDGLLLLVFSNGAALKVMPDTEVFVKEYKQADYDHAKLGEFLRLDKDPSKSVTQLVLLRGSVSGEVKNLNTAAGSKFSVVDANGNPVPLSGNGTGVPNSYSINPTQPPKLPAEVQVDNVTYGPEVKGLRVGVMFKPKAGDIRLGVPVEVRIVVKNFSDNAVQIAGSRSRQDGAGAISLQDEKGNPVKMMDVYFSARPLVQRQVLNPGETVEFVSSALEFLPKDSSAKPGDSVGRYAHVEPGRYTLRFKLKFPDVEITGANPLPIPGDWQGTLETSAITLDLPPPAPANPTPPTGTNPAQDTTPKRAEISSSNSGTAAASIVPARASVTLAGELQKPATLELPASGSLTLWQAIVAASGFTEKADTTRVIILHQDPKDPDKRILDIRNVAVLLQSNRIPENLLSPGDEIQVLAKGEAEKMILVTGAVKKPGFIPYIPGDPTVPGAKMAATTALGLAGGLVDPNQHEGVLIREAGGKRMQTNVEINKGISEKDFVLQPGDELKVLQIWFNFGG